MSLPIDLSRERAIRLLDIATDPRIAAATKSGRVHHSTIYRICDVGLLGVSGERVKLEWVRTCGGRFTSSEAIDRFLARVNGAPVPAAHGLPAAVANAAANREAERVLDAAGI